MIVLDTNVLSELMKWQPDKSVVRWIGEHQATSLFITTLTQAEIFYGLEILPAGKRRTALRKAAKAMFELDFAGRILPFDIKRQKQVPMQLSLLTILFRRNSRSSTKMFS